MIRTAIAHISGTTGAPYSPSKYYQVDKIGRESHVDYEKRTWRNRMHVNEEGLVYIPAMALKNTVQGAASFLGKKVPGRGAKTFAAFFKAALLVMDPVVLPFRAEDVPGEEFFVPSDGKAGGSTRVMKTFARIDGWKGIAKFYVADETITNDIFEEHLKTAGSFVGLGRFRPERGGFYGRFNVDKLLWE